VLQRLFFGRKRLELSFSGVGKYNNEVVFAKVNGKSIYDLRNRLMSGLRKEGIDLSGMFLLNLFYVMFSFEFVSF